MGLMMATTEMAMCYVEGKAPCFLFRLVAFGQANRKQACRQLFKIDLSENRERHVIKNDKSPESVLLFRTGCVSYAGYIPGLSLIHI